MTELERYEERPAAVTDLTVWAQSAQAAYGVAERLVTTSFVPAGFRGKPDEATAAILAGAEVGLNPMASLRSFDVIQGTAAPRAITLRAIVQSAGHEVRVEESTATRAVVVGRRRNESNEQRSIWTLDRAKQLGVTGKDNWRNQPQAMLLARATSEICRLIAADAILGIPYSTEELADGELVENVSAAPAEALKRRTAQRAPRPTPTPVETPAEEEPLPPEPANEEDVPLDPDRPMTDKQRSAIFAIYQQAGIDDPQEMRDGLTDIIGREVTTRAGLTVAEASLVIDKFGGPVKEAG